MKVVMGQKAKDIISGFTGIVTGTSSYISGCSQVMLTPQSLTAEGKRKESEWFDEQRIVPDGDGAVLVLDNEETPGMDEKAAPKK